jgi:uncharacterized hydrophobic protein (TIGR00271 family)
MAGVADGVSGMRGVRHLSLAEGGPGTASVLTADVSTSAADSVLGVLDRLAVPAEDIVFARLETISAASGDAEPIAVVWADLLGQARVQARAPGRYFVLMAAAGVVAAFAVLNESSVLIVGAMAISPDLLPVVAACTGIVLWRRRLAARGLGTLAAGLAVAGLFAAAMTGLLRVFDWLPPAFSLSEIPASQTHVGVSTILIALVAGVAGMVAMETRASAAVGVAISVTTIPAAAYLGVALGLGQLDKSLSAFWVLLANVAMMVAGGSTALAIQRSFAQRSQPPS